MNEKSEIDQMNFPLVVGIDLGGTQIRVAVLKGVELLSRISLSTGENPTPDRIIPRIHFAIQQALDKVGVALEQIEGIGMGVAGPLNSRTGVVFASPNLPGWSNVPLRSMLEEYYGLPIFIENDANVAALGEYLFGAGYGCKDIVYLTVSTGIGGGVITNGKLMVGTSGTAAELGHMTIDRKGERCNCGNIGCLESIASGTAIARRAREAVARGVDVLLLTDDKLERLALSLRDDDLESKLCQQPRIDAKAVAQAAEAGVPAACVIISDAAEGLGVGLVNIIHIFNPEMIILGGGLIQMGSLLMEPALKIVQESTMNVSYKSVRIVQSQLGIDAGLIGAGALIYSNAEWQSCLELHSFTGNEETISRSSQDKVAIQHSNIGGSRSLQGKVALVDV